MAAPTLDETKPVWGSGNQVGQNFTQLRNNVTWLLAMCAINCITVPPWNAVPHGSDLSKPDYVELTHAIDGRKVKATFSYTGDNVTGVELAFNDTGGYADFDYGSGTLTYDEDGNWTGTTWS